jgi:pyridoxamine 5'-phosphate oxidase
MRQDYAADTLDRGGLAASPFEQFGRWFETALACPEIREANAMTLATSDAAGAVHARIVLLKGWDENGFRFFTNYESAKAADLAANPRAALLFHWAPLERQVQICGPVARTSREESEAYFASRPLQSQFAAWASHQSAPLADRDEIEARYAGMAAKFGEGPVPLPDFWGGYVVRPETVEFWQGRRSRLHDRFRYARQADESWLVERLSP